MKRALLESNEKLIAKAEDDMDCAESRLIFVDEEEKETVDSIVNLAMKLGKLVADVANNSTTLRAPHLGRYIKSCFNWAFLKHNDIERDFEKFTDAFVLDDEDDDSPIGLVHIDADEAKQIIADVLKELRSK